jgi:hypothetical protein
MKLSPLIFSALLIACCPSLADQNERFVGASAATYVEQAFMATKIIGVRQRSRHWSRKRFYPG